MNVYTITISLLKRNGILNRAIDPKVVAEVMLLNNIISDSQIEVFLDKTKAALRSHLGFVLGFADTPIDVTLDNLSEDYHHVTFRVKAQCRPALFKEETELFLARLRRISPDKFNLFEALGAIIRIECSLSAMIQTVTMSTIVAEPSAS